VLSGPVVMPSGSLSGVGTANSVILPVTVMRPTQLAARSVNHTLPSRAGVMSNGSRPAAS
jgi:hypothetical protein